MFAQTILKDLPCGTELLVNQVAGHTFQVGSNEIGMLKYQQDGSVLKAAVKPICGAREVKFYEDLVANHNDSTLTSLRPLVPEYRGQLKMSFRSKIIDFIKLADLTHDMAEPCIIDIKIGKRTWDPLATPEKILAEEQKYEACKKKLGFCIPGFQVYDIKTGRIKKFGKEYGKKLNQNTVKEALKIFLNADSHLSRNLLQIFLSSLYSIQMWARSQTTLRLYSSSLLLVYDAKCLKSEICCNSDNNISSSDSNSYESVSSSYQVERKNKLSATSYIAEGRQKIVRPLNSKVFHQNSNTETNGIINSINKIVDFDFNEVKNGKNPVLHMDAFGKLRNYDSIENTYDKLKDLDNVRESYDHFMVHQIDGFGKNNQITQSLDSKAVEEWALVKMIDFAHVFPAEDASIDTNYLFGIESLVEIFEEFLQECELNL